MLFALETTIFAFTLWLGLDLLARDTADLRLRYAGLGLVAYALVVAALALSDAVTIAGRGLQGLLFLPAVFWFGAAAALLPEESYLRAWLLPFIRFGLPWAAGLILLLGLLTAGTAAYPLLAGLVTLLLLGSVIAAAAALRRDDADRFTPRQVRLLSLIVTLFFALGAGLLLLPLEIPWLPQSWIVLALSGDLEVLGFLILWLDAYEQGEALRADVLRSFLATTAAVILLGGQVVLVGLGGGFSPTLNLLLLSIIGTVVVGTVMARPLADLFDTLVFSSRIRRTRAELRQAQEAASRRDDTPELAAISSEKFVQLTRRALSHLPDLPRLAASPLTGLPQVTARLHNDGLADDTLGRANALRSLLIDSIDRLKPNDDRVFAPTDDWRFYNALYFPYVAGLKPYSRRAWHDHLDPAEKEALDWFRSQVPERTLYNWQNKAAELIAQDLKIPSKSENNR